MGDSHSLRVDQDGLESPSYGETGMTGWSKLCCFVALLPGVAFAQLPAARLDGLFPAGGSPGTTVEIVISGTDLDDVDQLFFSQEGFQVARKLAEVTPFDDGPQPILNTFLVTIPGVPAGNYEVRCQGKYGLSNPRTFVVGAFPEVVETEPNGGNLLPVWTEIEKPDPAKPETKVKIKVNPAVEIPALPATVNGQLTTGPDVDWYRFTGQGGQRILAEGYARRIDSRADLVLTLFHENGTILAENRALHSGDPLLDVTLPGNGLYFLKVHDRSTSRDRGISTAWPLDCCRISTSCSRPPGCRARTKSTRSTVATCRAGRRAG
jgi:hypothetical protein